MSYYSYIAYPIIALFLVVVITCVAIIIIQRQNRTRMERVIRINPEAVNLNIIRTGHEQEAICHSGKCVNDDQNPPFWKLNCGGLVCNQCITQYSNAIMSAQTLYCPVCREAVHVFNFYNSEATSQPPAGIQDMSMSDLCNICFERVPERKIECQSSCTHKICSFCYFRLVNVQKIRLCPFCRTPIELDEHRIV
jgi:hypothetical protein